MGDCWSVSDNLKGDKEVVCEALSNCGYALCYASKEIKSNKEIVLHALKNNPSAIAYASQELQDDDEIFKEYVYKKPFAYQITNNYLQAVISYHLCCKESMAPLTFSDNMQKCIDNKEFNEDFLPRNIQ